MKRSLLALCIPPLAACSNSSVSDPSQWSCEGLIDPIIEMSQERTPTILEITNPKERTRFYGDMASIECQGYAEWSQGHADIRYGARVTDGDNIVLEYRQW